MPPQKVKYKLTRKEMKQDGFVEWTGRAYDFVQANFLKLAIAVAALVVIVIAVSLYIQGRERGRQRASDLLFQGQVLLATGNYAAAGDRLQEAVDRYAGTEFGRRAHVDLAHALLASGRADEALSVTREGLERAGSRQTELRQALLMVQAASLSSLGRGDEALIVYRGLLAQDLPAPLRIEASFRAAEVQKERGDMQAAVATLEELERSAARGDLPGPVRDLTERLRLYRALASR